MRLIRPVVVATGVLALLGSTSAFAQAPQTPAAWSISDCQTCHETALGTAFTRSKHAQAAESCASCHPNVAEHVRAQQNGESGAATPAITTQGAERINSTCLACHEKDNQANYLGTLHARRKVACTACHSVHAPKSKRAQLKTKVDSETCYGCHKSERAKTLRTSHHPVREGKLGCTSCHNPHDGEQPKMLRADSVNELCYTCHTEKRGPFLYEHAPVREECLACHDPHGSNHERLLVAKQPYLCQRCHFSGHGLTADNASSLEGLPVAPPGATATRSSRNTERGCKNCHLNIHGSNSPSGAYFVR